MSFVKEESSLKAPDVKQLLHDIWLQPRATIRRIINYQPGFKQKSLIFAMTVINGLTPVYQGLEMISINLLLNFLLLVLSIYGTALLLWLTGKVIGGQGSFEALATALTWSLVPALFGSAIGLIASLFGPAVYNALFFFGLLLLLWSLHIAVDTVAEVQRFTYWKSVLNNLLVLMLLLPVFYGVVSWLLTRLKGIW